MEIAVPMAICCLTYTLLYCIYPRDRQRAQRDLLIAPDEQRCEEGNDSEPSAVRAREDEESAVRSINQRLIST
uniref:Uncharacterized protein n=1 Tax=Arundo donax TaxID=35708 RepID=A0A0A9FU79_ARUDO